MDSLAVRPAVAELLDVGQYAFRLKIAKATEESASPLETDGERCPLAHSGEPPEDDRASLAVRIWRVVVVILLILALLLVLAYCLTQVNDDDGGTATPVPSATGPTASATGVRTTATRNPSTAHKSGTARPGAARSGTAGNVGSPTTTSKAVTSAAAATTTTVPPRAPRAAPNTGGGSIAGGPNLVMVLTGSVLLTASFALGLFTLRRWRRAW